MNPGKIMGRKLKQIIQMNQTKTEAPTPANQVQFQTLYATLHYGHVIIEADMRLIASEYSAV